MTEEEKTLTGEKKPKRVFSKEQIIQIVLAALMVVCTIVCTILCCVTSGKVGPQGEQGLQGATGATGAVGATGETGATGEKGDKGDKGDTGATGATGEKGEKGDPGEKGDKGDKGDKGNTGATGAKGEDGVGVKDIRIEIINGVQYMIFVMDDTTEIRVKVPVQANDALTLAEAIAAADEEGEQIVMTNGTAYTLPADLTTNPVIGGNFELVGNNATVAEASLDAGIVIKTDNTKFTNIVFEDKVVVEGTAVFENCTFKEGFEGAGVQITTFSLAASGLEFNGCDFNNQNVEIAESVTSVTFNECVEVGSIQTMAPIQLINTEFVENAVVTANESAFNNVVLDGTEVTVKHNISDSMKTASEPILASVGEYNIRGANGVTIIGAGTDKTVIESTNGTVGCTIENATVNDIYHVKDLTLKNCIINSTVSDKAEASQVSGNVSFVDCQFIAMGSGDASFWADTVESGSIIAFENCTFDGSAKFGGEETVSYEFTDCTFSQPTLWPKYANVVVYTPTTFTNCTFDQIRGIRAAEGMTSDDITLVNTDTNIELFTNGYVINNAEGMAWCVENVSTLQNKTVYFDVDDEVFDINGANGVTIIGAGTDKTVIKSTNGTVGCTIKNATVNDIYGAHNLTLIDCDVNVGVTESAYASQVSGECKFVGCTFDGKGEGASFWVDSIAENTTVAFEGCTFVGSVKLGSNTGVSYAFTDCDFSNPTLKPESSNLRTYAPCSFTNCTFDQTCGISVAIENMSMDNIQLNNTDTSIDINGKCVYSKGNYIISSAEGMFWFADQVNVNGNTFAGKTVYLGADIDLENAAWTPIGQTGATEFKGVFDGQNHTISNLYIDNNDEGAKCSSGLFGWIESHGSEGVTVKNVIIDGATVKGYHNVAVIVGYVYGTIENCTVNGATVESTHANDDACGDKTGLIAGYVGEDATIKGCVGTNSTITVDGRDAGQIVGAAKEACVVDCSATNVTVTAEVVNCNHSGAGGNVREELIGRVLG